ncbi:MAG: helix-turn-helix transcriptional regulator [Phycisphaerales bacterium]|nr:helix-turn-helix transcriptional regulator [Phycisphaerales bacterium]
MGDNGSTFGRVLREKRVKKGFTLRRFAEMVGISPTYLSQVEQGKIGPPTSGRVMLMAELLGENPDEWIGLAGRMPDDIPGILQSQPTALPELLREVKGMTPEQLHRLKKQAQKIMKKDQDK